MRGKKGAAAAGRKAQDAESRYLQEREARSADLARHRAQMEELRAQLAKERAQTLQRARDMANEVIQAEKFSFEMRLKAEVTMRAAASGRLGVWVQMFGETLYMPLGARRQLANLVGDEAVAKVNVYDEDDQELRVDNFRAARRNASWLVTRHPDSAKQ